MKPFLKKADTRVMFINQILIISSAVFGILVSLHSESDKHNQIAFALSLVLLLLGILLLCIGLFGYVKVQDSLTKEILYQANRQYSGSTPDPATVDRKIGELNRKCEKIRILDIDTRPFFFSLVCFDIIFIFPFFFL